MKLRHILSIVALAMICFSLLSGDATASTAGPVCAMAAFAIGDALLKQTKTLPATATTATTSAIDLGHGTNGQNLADHEFVLEAPALTTGELGDTNTIIYDVITSASSDLSSPTTVIDNIITQTGAGGAGAAAVTKRFRLPSDCQRYVGVVATASAADDASAKSMVLSLKF
jgi:hypothetical protein